jgi:hypothetical protein
MALEIGVSSRSSLILSQGDIALEERRKALAHQPK